jgi:hypothetical protein
MARKLRIAVSVYFGLLTVALCVMWVRSYYWIDNVVGPVTATQQIGFASSKGWLTLRSKRPPSFQKWSMQSRTPAQLEAIYEQMRQGGGQVRRSAEPHFGLTGDGAIQFPHWLPTVTVAILASLPWVSPRFSLRTLLIATTLVAVVLGLVVWMVR